MATRILRNSLLVACLIGVVGCASTETDDESYVADRKRTPSAQEAARVLGCTEDEVAVCVQTNCELDEFYCANRDDVKRMFRAGEFRYE